MKMKKVKKNRKSLCDLIKNRLLFLEKYSTTKDKNKNICNGTF